jgi:hypothetical protein
LVEDDRDGVQAAGDSGRISEDWAATIIGLMLLGLALAGLITKAMVP